MKYSSPVFTGIRFCVFRGKPNSIPGQVEQDSGLKPNSIPG